MNTPKLVLLCCVLSAAVSLLCSSLATVRPWRPVRWQHDAARAAEAERHRREDAAAKAYQQALKAMESGQYLSNSATVYATNIVINSTMLITNNSYWSYYGTPQFRDSDVELGFRPDGLVCWRVPPELRAGRNVLQRLGDRAKVAVTNVFK